MCLRPSFSDEVFDLPLPANKTAGADGTNYSKSEAAGIIHERSEKGTTLRTRMMSKMIDLRLAPTTMKNLWRLVQKFESGQHIIDSPWEFCQSKQRKSHGRQKCKGIQSKRLDDAAPLNLKYCYDKKWYMDSTMKWHVFGCHDQDTDNNGRCKKMPISVHSHESGATSETILPTY